MLLVPAVKNGPGASMDLAFDAGVVVLIPYANVKMWFLQVVERLRRAGLTAKVVSAEVKGGLSFGEHTADELASSFIRSELGSVQKC